VLLARAAARSVQQLGVPMFMLLVVGTTFASILYEVEWDPLIDECVRLWLASGIDIRFIRSRPLGVVWDCLVCDEVNGTSTGECATCNGYPGAHTQCIGIPWAQTFPSVVEAMWFVGVTMTTVGYGDQVPYTWQGRVVAGLIIIFGILFLAMPLAIVGSTFMDVWKARHVEKLRALVQQLLTENEVLHDASGVALAFLAMDRADDGVVESQEFDDFVRDVLGFQIAHVAMNDIGCACDTNATGAMNIIEFAALCFPRVTGQEVVRKAGPNARRQVVVDIGAERANESGLAALAEDTGTCLRTPPTAQGAARGAALKGVATGKREGKAGRATSVLAAACFKRAATAPSHQQRSADPLATAPSSQAFTALEAAQQRTQEEVMALRRALGEMEARQRQTAELQAAQLEQMQQMLGALAFRSRSRRRGCDDDSLPTKDSPGPRRKTRSRGDVGSRGATTENALTSSPEAQGSSPQLGAERLTQLAQQVTATSPTLDEGGCHISA